MSLRKLGARTMTMIMNKNSFWRIRAVLAILAMAAVGATAVWAQTSPSTGAVQGVVKDQSGAVVPGATVTLKNLALGIGAPCIA